jgi:hypothetical protein
MSAQAGPVTVEVETSPPTVVVVKTADGQRYTVKIALIVTGGADTGLRNPLDDMPIINLVTQTVVQITRKTDG